MKLFIIFLVLTFLGPLTLLFSGKIDLHADYRTANRQSAQIAPDPKTHPEAVIQVYSAPAFSWRGIFATHIWIATKLENAPHYMVYQVIGWRLLQQLPPLVIQEDIPDRYWFNAKPSIILDLRGEAAQKLTPRILEAAKQYPYANDYLTWPGPNSNTFPAYIGRHIPELHLTLPSNALGKDFLAIDTFFARSPSGTGFQFSLLGIFGVMIAKQEGLEINILGLVYGISPMTRTIKLPGFGDIKLI